MITIKYLKDAFETGNHIYFNYKGKQSGVEPNVENSVFTYEMWYGEKWKEYDSFEKMITDKFFDGKSIVDLIKEKVDFRFV